MSYYEEIPWPADPDTLPRDDNNEIVVGRFTVGLILGDTTWSYFDSDGNAMGEFESAYDAVNEGALRDDYRGTDD